MAAQAGKDILLKIEGAPVASPGVFTTVAGLRARTCAPPRPERRWRR